MRRSLLRRGCRAAEFGDVRLVSEPVAAVNYFVEHLRHDVSVGASIVVHDFGGGTFDATVVDRTESGFQVSSLDGLDQLGGIDTTRLYASTSVADLQDAVDRISNDHLR